MAPLLSFPREFAPWLQPSREELSARSSAPSRPAETIPAFTAWVPHHVTSAELISFSHDSPTQLVGMLVMGGFLGFLCFFLTYHFIRRCFVHRINRAMQRRYINIEQSQSQSSGSSWHQAPPSYEQSITNPPRLSGRILQRPRRLSVHPTSPETAAQTSSRVLDSRSRSQAAINQQIGVRSAPIRPSDAMQRAVTTRDVIIQLEREQTLMRLEGNPLGGNHTRNVSADSFRRFVREMKLNCPTRRKAIEDAAADVKKPAPLRLRGGGGRETFPGSADDIVRRIKEWFHKQKDAKDALLQKKVKHEDSDSEVAVAAKEGHLARLKRKRAERKQERFVQYDRESTLRKLEGRP